MLKTDDLHAKKTRNFNKVTNSQDDRHSENAEQRKDGCPVKNRKGVIAYLLIAFGIAWILWEGVIRLGTSLNPIVKGILMLPTAFAPAIATFVVRKWITREGFAEAGLRLNLRKWR